MDLPGGPDWLTESNLHTPLRRLLGNEVSSISDWSCLQIVGGGDELGVWRVSGTAIVAGADRPWTIFLKGWPPPQIDADPADWDWPGRETLLYRSRIVADLAGHIIAPRFLGEMDRPDASHWLWLEGISDDADPPWALERYGLIARRLGQMNGRFLPDKTLPDEAWLSRNWLRQWVEEAEQAVRDLKRHADHPLIHLVLPPSISSSLIRLWAERKALFALLEELPQTFCHLDAFRRNLFLRQRPDGSDEIVAIDWGYAGIAALGEEIAPLVAATLFFGDVPPSDAQRLESLVMDGYIDGLHDAGWSGGADQVLTGYVASVALRYGIGTLRGQLFYFLEERNFSRMERMMGMPMPEIIDLFRILNEWVAQHVVAARAHVRKSR